MEKVRRGKHFINTLYIIARLASVDNTRQYIATPIVGLSRHLDWMAYENWLMGNDYYSVGFEQIIKQPCIAPTSSM